MIPKEFEWRTNAGELLDIRWMDSVHLVHSFNMLCRGNQLASTSFMNGVPPSTNNILGNLTDEITARGYFEWSGAQTPQYGQLLVPRYREKKAVLCMFRAMMDYGMPSSARAVLHGYTQIESCLLQKGDSWAPVIAAYAAYRLERS